MSQPLSLPVRIVSGSLVLGEQTKKHLCDRVKQMKDGEYRLIIEKKRTKHSDALRGYYFGVIVKLGAETTGYSVEEFHELAKALHLDKQDAADGKNGRILGEYVIGGSIAKLPNGPMSEFVGRVREWMVGALDCTTPEPDPNWKDNEEAA